MFLKIKNYVFLTLIGLIAFSVPHTASAAMCYPVITPRSLVDFICIAIDWVQTAMPIVAALALVMFFWGLAKYIVKAGSEDAHEEGREIMKWGIVALFVLVSIWGIIALISGDIFGISPTGIPLLPTN